MLRQRQTFLVDSEGRSTKQFPRPTHATLHPKGDKTTFGQKPEQRTRCFCTATKKSQHGSTRIITKDFSIVFQ